MYYHDLLSIPSHPYPFALRRNPMLQEHVYEPTLLWQLCAHLSVPSAHSLISVQ